MSIAKCMFEEHEERLMAITAIGIEIKALILDEATDEVSSTDDPDAERLLYANAFQAWADGKFEGSADEVFEAVQEVLEV